MKGTERGGWSARGEEIVELPDLEAQDNNPFEADAARVNEAIARNESKKDQGDVLEAEADPDVEKQFATTSSEATAEAVAEQERQFAEARKQGAVLIEAKLKEGADPAELLDLRQAELEDKRLQIDEMNDSGDAWQNLGGSGDKSQTTMITKLRMEEASLVAQIEALKRNVAEQSLEDADTEEVEIKKTGTEG